MKRLGILFALGMLSINFAAAQSLDMIEGAAELSLSDIILPNNTSGTVTFSECEACETKRLSLDSETVFIGQSGPVTLADFLLEVAELRLTAQGQDTFVSLFYDLRSNRVTRIRLHPDAS